MNNHNPPKTIGRLNTSVSCRREMARVYREARRGQLDSLVAYRYVNMLRLIVVTIEGAQLDELVDRLDRLEAVRAA